MNQPPASRRPPFYRRRYLVDRGFQLSIVGYFLGLFLFSIGFLFFGIRRTLSMMDAQAIRLDPKHTAILEVLRDDRQTFLAEFFLLYSFAILTATVIGGIVLSHRMAGPLYRLKRILAELAEGRPVSRIEFRKQDHLQDLVPSLKKVAKRISGEEP
ncbi:MAG TPA: hypothetical protein VM598_06790 [Bdellovibrionota bacterium]|nr:hypothetical protein [Bdellovibrionota bacterium]